jgi:hypothetical protein
MRSAIVTIPRRIRLSVREWEVTHRDHKTRSAEYANTVKQRWTVPLYYLPLLAVLNKQGFSAALRTGWAHIVLEDDEAYLIQIDDISDRHSRLVHGQAVPKEHPTHIALKLLHRLWQRRRGTKPSFAVISVPPLVNMGIWLKSSRGGSEVVLLHSGLGSLKIGASITESKFLSKLAQPSREMLEHASDRLHPSESVSPLEVSGSTAVL